MKLIRVKQITRVGTDSQPPAIRSIESPNLDKPISIEPSLVKSFDYKPDEMQGVNAMVYQENHNFMNDLGTQKKRLSYQFYPKVNTMTSKEFGNLNVPGTAYKLSFYDTPLSGNWAL